MKKLIVFFFMIFVMNSIAFAEDITVINTNKDIEEKTLPVSEAALNIAIEKITDRYKDMLLANIASESRITVGKMIYICNGGIAIPLDECSSFVREYLNILTNRTNCFKANNFEKVIGKYAGDAGIVHSFSDCFGLAEVGWYEKDGTQTGRTVAKDSSAGQCKQWIEAAEKCQIYLNYYYQDKLLDPDITKKEKKQYKCILDKLEKGEFEVPTSKMENDCK
ncbi:MAG: hypothetical protein IKN73_01270 [Alphaproteobacteria bacterium]|nr:hypothetical protein [Alphaproteobacteria bacterium]